MAEIIGLVAMGTHTWMRIFYICSAGQEVNIFDKGLASYCYAKTTFTFHSSILKLPSAFLSIDNREMKSESGFSLAMASQPFSMQKSCSLSNQFFLIFVLRNTEKVLHIVNFLSQGKRGSPASWIDL